MADVKLFEQTENTSPSMAQRLAFGRVGNPSENMTLTNFVAWLLTKLGFLKVALNFADVNNPATCRTNLSVYSKTEVNTALSGKQATLTSGPGLAMTRVGSYVDSDSFYSDCVRYGNVAVCTGQLKFNSLPSPGVDILTLPAGVGVPKQSVWLIGACSTGIGRPVFSAYINVATNTVKFASGDNGYDYYFNFSFII